MSVVKGVGEEEKVAGSGGEANLLGSENLGAVGVRSNGNAVVLSVLYLLTHLERRTWPGEPPFGWCPGCQS